MKIVVSAAVLSDRKEEYITMIQELSPSSQTELMNVINEVRVPSRKASPLLL
jgi:predicted transcriptional regulator